MQESSTDLPGHVTQCVLYVFNNIKQRLNIPAFSVYRIALDTGKLMLAGVCYQLQKLEPQKWNERVRDRMSVNVCVSEREYEMK